MPDRIAPFVSLSWLSTHLRMPRLTRCHLGLIPPPRALSTLEWRHALFLGDTARPGIVRPRTEVTQPIPVDNRRCIRGQIRGQTPRTTVPDGTAVRNLNLISSEPPRTRTENRLINELVARVTN